jgi:hypothetical protein
VSGVIETGDPQLDLPGHLDPCLLRATYLRTRSYLATGRELGCSDYLVKKHLRLLGVEPLSLNRRDQLTDQQILDAWNKSGSAYQVAETFGVGPVTAYEWLAALGIEVQEKKRWAKREDERLIREYESYREESRVEELARKMKRSPAAVMLRARKLGLSRRNRDWRAMTDESGRELLDDFIKSKLSVQNFCERRGLKQDFFSRTMTRLFGDEFRDAVESNWPKNTWYVRGRDFERRSRKLLERNGFPHVIRSYRSQGPADLTAIGPFGSLLVQCKRGAYMKPGEHNTLWERAVQSGGIPILTGMKDGRRIRVWVLVGRHEGNRKRPLREIRFPLGEKDRALIEAVLNQLAQERVEMERQALLVA